MDKAVEHSEKADYYQEKLSAMNANRAISSDDPDALDLLRAKLAGMEAEQTFMREMNKLVRKVLKLIEKGSVTAADAGQKLTDLATEKGLSINPSAAAKVMAPDFADRQGYAGYLLTNNNANMKRVKDRIATLEEQHQSIAGQGEPDDVRHEALGLTVVTNNSINRLQLVFDGKPEAGVRTTLKSNGFRWSPSEGAWQRQLNSAADNAADRVIKQLSE
jgi:hypothetical protein